MSESQLTHRCHIIPKWYMKWFAVWANKDIIYYSDLTSDKIKIERKNWYECDYWFHMDSYNFIDENWNIIDWLESYYAHREKKKSNELHKLLEHLYDMTKWINHLWINEKKWIVRILSILYEKVVYYHYLFPLLKWRNIINKDWYYLLVRLLISFRLYWWVFLKLLLLKKFKWIILFCETPIFYFWDIPAHITTNWYNNSLQDFLMNIWSNIIFPLSKNFLIAIENNNDNFWDTIVKVWKEYIISNFIEHVKKESLLSAVLNRLILNFQEYIAWPDKEIIEKAISARNIKNIYHRDVFIYATCEKFWPMLDVWYKDLQWMGENITNDYITHWIVKNHKIMTYLDELLDLELVDYIAYVSDLSKCEINNILKHWDFEKIFGNFEIFWVKIRDKIWTNSIYR